MVQIVESASRHKFVIIPYGGGTSVSGSITCPEQESRPIVALDTSDMNSILWIDKEQLLARLQVTLALRRSHRTSSTYSYVPLLSTGLLSGDGLFFTPKRWPNFMFSFIEKLMLNYIKEARCRSLWLKNSMSNHYTTTGFMVGTRSTRYTTDNGAHSQQTI